MVSPEGTQEGEKQAACPLSCQPLQLLPTLHPEGIQDGEKQDTGPTELRCIPKQ